MYNNIEDLKKTIIDTVNNQSEDLYEFLSTYIKFQTINPRLADDADKDSVERIRQCQTWLAEKLNEFDCYDDIQMPFINPNQPNIVAIRRGTGDGKGLFFNGHTDVVPVSNKQKQEWKKLDPWSGEISDGRIWGRGASDMKGGNVSFIWAIKVLNDLGVDLKGDCYATIVVGEETADRELGIGAVMSQSELPKTGVIAEATDFKICPATMGEFYFSIKINGKSSNLALRHKSIYPTAYDEEIPGVNAIDLMRKIQERLAELERQWGMYRKHPLMTPGGMSITISRINGGDTYSAMADSCEINGGVIYAPNLTFEEVRDEFLQAIQQVVDSDYWMQQNPPEITIPYFIPNKPSNNLSMDHPLSKTLERVQADLTKEEPVFSIPVSNTNDGNYMVNHGYETITFGAGEHGNHGSNEHVVCEDILELTKLYAISLLEWCGWSAS